MGYLVDSRYITVKQELCKTDLVKVGYNVGFFTVVKWCISSPAFQSGADAVERTLKSCNFENHFV